MPTANIENPDRKLTWDKREEINSHRMGKAFCTFLKDKRSHVWGCAARVSGCVLGRLVASPQFHTMKPEFSALIGFFLCAWYGNFESCLDSLASLLWTATRSWMWSGLRETFRLALRFSRMALSFESHVLNQCLEIIVVISGDPYDKSISSDKCQNQAWESK
jgi:hypothetical protein